jgi:hypothetical protein
MALKNPLSLKDHLYILVHGGTGSPQAFQMSLQRVSTILVMGTGAFTACVLGTLLFFRELELNRKLQDQLLDAETREKLGQVLAANHPAPGTAASAAVPATAPAPAREAAATTVGTDDEGAASGSSSAGRVNDLQVDCTKGKCAVRLSLMTDGSGTADGQLLIILESEIPRIGTGATSGAPLRKRYFIYPGDITRDELDQSSLSQLDSKSFHFARALQTSVTFQVGKLLRPLAVNAYIYDKDHALVQHERKVIESESESDGDAME